MTSKNQGSRPPVRNPGPLTVEELKLPHPLETVFKDALAQVTRGKGEARHGHGADFMSQPWLEIANAHGTGFLTGQCEKKLRESAGLDYTQRRAERLGAIVYLAMAIVHDDMKQGVK